MTKLRVTIRGMALIVNRPTASLVVFPKINHKFHLTGPFGSKLLPAGTDIRLVQKGAVVGDAPTLRAGSDLVPHLDHITGTRVNLPVNLFGAACPAGVNTRFFLSGGRLQGLSAASYGGMMRNVTWTFASDSHTHAQRLTDTVEFTRDLPGDGYGFKLSSGKTLALKSRGAEYIDIMMMNDDECDDPPPPDFLIREFGFVFDTAGLQNFVAKVSGDKSNGIAAAFTPLPSSRKSKKKRKSPTGTICDDICPPCQADA